MADAADMNALAHTFRLACTVTAVHLLVISKVCNDGLLVVSQHTLSLPECLHRRTGSEGGHSL